MHYARFKRRNGATRYKFYYWDPIKHKNCVVPAERVRHILNDQEADAYVRMHESTENAAKLRIEQKLAWQKKFYDVEKLYDLYAENRKREAPRSWDKDLYYLKFYVFDFFLNVKQLNNVNVWDMYYKEFKDWLRVVKPARKNKLGNLAPNTQDNVIKALNTFINTLHEERLIEHNRKCRALRRDELGARGLESLLEEDEMERVYQQLLTTSPQIADLFWVLLNTGLRLNESLGLHLGSLQNGQPTEKNLLQMMKRNGISCHGYIVLEDQPKTRDIRRKDGHIERVPLKGRKKITPKNNRIIPIENARAFNTLVRLFRTQKELYQARKFGPDIKNYLLFDGLTQSMVTSHLRKGFEPLRLRFKSAHCYRHTYSTHLCGKYNDMLYLKMVLGHSDVKITERYVHLYEAMQRGLVTTQNLSAIDDDDFQFIEEA